MKRIFSIVAAAALAVGSFVIVAPVAQALPGDFTITDSVNAGDHGTITVTSNIATDSSVDINAFPANVDIITMISTTLVVPAGGTVTWDWSVPSNASGPEWIYTEINVLVTATQENIYFQSVPYVAGVITGAISSSMSCGTDGQALVANGLATDQSVYFKLQGNGGNAALLLPENQFGPYGNNADLTGLNRYVYFSFVPGSGDTSYTVQLLNSADDSVVFTSQPIKVNCPAPPVFTYGPKLAVTPRVGTRETCLARIQYEGANPTVSYYWLVNGVRNGALGMTYIPKVSDLGKTLACGATATDDIGVTTRYSSAARVALGFAPHIIAPYYPKLVGTPYRGRYVALYPGRWTPSSTIRYVMLRWTGTKWVVASKLLSYSTKFKIPTTYRRGTVLRAKVFAYKTGYTTGVRYTAYIKVR